MTLIVAAIASGLGFGSKTYADAYGSNGGTNLSLAGNWVDETVPANSGINVPGASDIVRWDASAALVNPTAFTLNGSTTWLGIAILNPGAAISISDDGSVLNLGASGIDSSSASQDLTLNSVVHLNSSQTWSTSAGHLISDTNIISGSANLAKTGLGTLILSGNNTYSGNTTISSGKLQLGNGSNSGSVSGAIIDNGTLVLNRSDTVNVANLISGSGGFTQAGSGTVQLSSANSFTGAVAITAGTVQLTGTGTIGAGALTNTLSISSSAKLDLNGNGAIVGSLSGSGTIDNSSSGGTVLNILGGNTLFTGSIQNSGGGALSVIKNGTGTLTLGGTSSYSGNTVINSGVLFVMTSAALGNTSGINVNTINGLQLGDGVTESAPITVNSGSNEFLDLPGSANATLGGDVIRLGTSQYRLGISGTGVLTVTGNQLGLNASTFITRGNVTFAGNSTLSTGMNPFVIGYAATPLNLSLKDDAAVSGNGVNFGSGQSDPSIAVNLSDTSSLDLGGGNVELYGGTNPSGNVCINIAGNSTLTAGSFTKTGTTQTASINLNGGTLVAGASSTAFLPAMSNLAVNVGANGGTIDDNGFTITIAQPLVNQTAQNDAGITKKGSGTVILAGANTYRGDTTILEGTLQLNDGGSVTGNITNNATLAFNNSSTMTRPNAISGSGGISQTGPGTTILAGDYTATGPVSLAVGNITFPYTNAPRETAGVVIKASNLFIAPTSVLDVTNHDLIIGNTSYDTIQAEILNGFGAGLGGASITSSTATGGAPTFLVPIDASAAGLTEWDNVAIDQPNTVIIKYDTFGDTTFDGLVNGDDITAVESHFGETTPGLANIEESWLVGDVNFDGVVDGNDITAIESEYGATIETRGIAHSLGTVPEPASLAMFGLGTAFMITRRRLTHTI